MLLKSSRPPCGGQARQVATIRPCGSIHPVPSPPAPSASHGPAAKRTSRPASALSAAAFDATSSRDEEREGGQRISALRVSMEAELESPTGLVTTKFIVPYFVTKPGQQLFLSGSTPELGDWDPHLAIPMEWQEGHQHTAVVRLPSSRVAQVKLVLKENGQPVLTEEGSARDIMLLPVTDDSGNASGRQEQGSRSAEGGEVDAAGAGPAAAAAGPRLDYQIMCHFGNTEATQILRLPVVLPAREAGDRRVLCKFVVMLDGTKLEARQYPVVVGGVPELGNWKAENGVKLMRQVGGYWTRRVELPLHGDSIQAKVVICNPDGQAVLWEPGTTNRMLAARREGGPQDDMYIFVCRWSQPDFTPSVVVPVAYEDANKEYIKMLDAAQKEIGIMRMAVTAKSRQVQSLESELSSSRRMERTLREEVGGLRNEMGYLMQELEVAQQAELHARQDAAELQGELQQLRDNYERQISFLESKLDDMEREITTLQERLANGHSNGNGNSDNGHSSSYYEHEEAPRVYSRSNWR